MKTKVILSVCFFLLCSSVCRASVSDTVRLYYGIAQYKLSSNGKHTLINLIDTITSDKMITVNGFTDYLGGKVFNQILSEKRARFVKQFLESARSNLKISFHGYGEVAFIGKHNKLGNAFNRKVEIVITKLQSVGNPPKRDTNIATQKTTMVMGLHKKVPSNQLDLFKIKIDSIASAIPGKSIDLDELTFLPGRHFLTPESMGLLKSLADYLRDHAEITFEIRGHICCDYIHNDGLDLDTKTFNLSLNRAKEIYNYLLKNGINESRMNYSGVGNTKPKVFPEVTNLDKQLNRRVELIIGTK